MVGIALHALKEIRWRTNNGSPDLVVVMVVMEGARGGEKEEREGEEERE